MQRSGRIGSISGIRADSFSVLLGDASRPWPRADGEWHDMLKRCTPVKEGAAMPGEWARLIKHTQKEKNTYKVQYIIQKRESSPSCLHQDFLSNNFTNCLTYLFVKTGVIRLDCAQYGVSFFSQFC